NSHWFGRRPGREGAAVDDPEPGDLRIAAGTIPRVEEEGPLPFTSAIQTYLPPITLVLGGARSGKSRYAESLVESVALGGTYCATAEAGDEEMAKRIAAHRARRGAFWHTVEAPLALAPVIGSEAASERPVLIDCLTLWLSNLLLAGKPVEEETGA